MKKTFKTISEFKKKLEVGDYLNTIFHCVFNGRDEDGCIIYKSETKGIRKVSIKQTNSFALETTKKDGTITDSWCDYPKAKDCIIVDNRLEIYEDYTEWRKHVKKKGKRIVLTYKFADPEEQQTEQPKQTNLN